METQVTGSSSDGSEIDRVVQAAKDSLTDDMITRLASTATGAMDMVDRINRSGLGDAIPALAALVQNGDLDRIVQLARLVGSAQDALTDDMVGRLAETIGEGMSLLDRFNRAGAGQIVGVLETMHSSGSLDRIATMLPDLMTRLEHMNGMLEKLEQSAATVAGEAPASGGVGSAYRLFCNKENQEVMRFFFGVGKEMRSMLIQKK